MLFRSYFCNFSKIVRRVSIAVEVNPMIVRRFYETHPMHSRLIMRLCVDNCAARYETLGNFRNVFTSKNSQIVCMTEMFVSSQYGVDLQSIHRFSMVAARFCLCQFLWRYQTRCRPLCSLVQQALVKTEALI